MYEGFADITCNYHFILNFFDSNSRVEPMLLIDREDPKPLHSQLVEIIRKRIETGVYPAKSRLPSERELCEEFDLSRTTIREMLRQLKKDGLIYTLAGRGAFVRTIQRDIAVNISLEGFSSDLQRSGSNPTSVLLGAELISNPEQKIVEEMGLTSEAEVVKVERLRFNNEIPLAIHTAWLNHRYCPQILKYNLAQSSLFSILKENYGLKIQKATQKVYASLASPMERKLLSLSNPSAVLHAERITFLENSEIIEYSIAAYCGDFYRLLIHLNADETQFAAENN